MTETTSPQVAANLATLREYRAGRHPFPFGSFLTAVLANNLVDALAQADEENRFYIAAYASFLYNEMPMRTGDDKADIWGSYEAVRNEIARQRKALVTGAEFTKALPSES